ncbi:5'-nucleotidase C-terminal domain-containing protein [Oculatella sp. LEGE 06141]|uniref:5'-nucleotidase C-terminal domain-containing protein n=1 Tax=Oculatella sp. LEGE 06141 TaxID=1828648 RepID=UPI0018817744|nr:5'-nucleotidase C-terminal domain-containing protein [Oculatella sp. LEGE 06141]MBE9180813.1 5'-nucleotidase C-terminal domain-containing protein [Oculatella sp. LEGE 06141]
MVFKLQLLHASDQEAGIAALQDAPRFSAVLNALRDDFPNTLVLSSGDAYIPGAFFSASDEVFGGVGRGDILIQNELGFQAIAFGNHEFDRGTGVVADVLTPSTGYVGAQFPYLSANLDFSTDSSLAGLVTNNGQQASSIPGKIAASTVITVNGETVGVVGATTPTLRTISSPGGVTVLPPNASDLQSLAAEIQQEVDALTATGVNKVVLLSHLQQIALEQQLAPLLRNVDIVMAGGSNTLLSDSTDRLRAGDQNEGAYPILTQSATGQPIAIINTDGNYKYVGRLVVDFDDNGVIIPTSIDANVSGAYATDEQGVAAVGGTPDPEVVAITQALSQVIAVQEGNIFGRTEVFLNGTRGDVRTQETNLGNLTADANLAVGQQVDPTVLVSIKNGGGIRNDIGSIDVPTGATNPDDFIKSPPAANELAGKQAGDISQLDVQNALSFNNALALVTLTAQQLLQIVEHGVSQTAAGATPGQFPQIGGLAFSYDAARPAGDRVLSLSVKDQSGQLLDTIARDGEVVGDPGRAIRIVTLSFLADGGDGYPFDDFIAANPTFANRVDFLGEDANGNGVFDGDERDLNLNGRVDGPVNIAAGAATFAAPGTEQDALAEYLLANFRTMSFNDADTEPSGDLRIQNVAVRRDTVLGTRSTGTSGNDRLIGGPSDDVLIGLAGEDTLTGRNGNDRLLGGTGRDRLVGGLGQDTLIGGGGSDILRGGGGRDIFVLQRGNGVDLIQDFNDGQDRLGLTGNLRFGNLTITTRGSNTQISFQNAQLATLRNVSADDLTAADFVRVNINAA